MTPASKPAAASAAVDAAEVLQLLQSIVADVLGEAVDPTQPLMEVCLSCSGDLLLPVQLDTCSTPYSQLQYHISGTCKLGGSAAKIARQQASRLPHTNNNLSEKLTAVQ